MGIQNHGNKCHFLETILHNVYICDNLTATTYKKISSVIHMKKESERTREDGVNEQVWKALFCGGGRACPAVRFGSGCLRRGNSSGRPGPKRRGGIPVRYQRFHEETGQGPSGD